MSWVSALKEWNTGKGTWCIPKKGTTEHGEVLAIIERKKRAASPASVPQKTKEELDEDKRVAEMRLYLAQRKIFSRLKDPIRAKLERVNETRVDDMTAMYEWKNKLNDLTEKWQKSASYKALEAAIDAMPYDGRSRAIDPMVLLNPTTPEWKKTAASKYGLLIVAHLKNKPAIAKDVGRRFNTKVGSDELGMKGSSKREFMESLYPPPK